MKPQKFKQTEIGKIPEEWEIKEIGDTCQLVKNIFTPSSKDNFHYIGLEHIEQGTLKLNGVGKSSEIESNKFFFKKGQILFGKLRPYFRKVIRPNFEGVCSTDIWVINSKEGFDNSFLFYFFADKRIIDEATNSSEGTKMPRAVWSYISNLKYKFPLPPEQISIAQILSSLDTKIELNNKMNKTLETIGQALFKKWFVDNPEKEKWKIGKLGDIGEFKNGINYLRDEVGDTEFSIINVRDISNNKWILKNSLDKIRINRNKAQEYFLDEKDIMIARSACPGKISLMLGNTDNSIYSGFSIRYRLNNLENYFYLSFILENLSEEIKNFSIGTTLSSVNQETLKNIKIIIPDDKTIQEFNKIIQPIFKHISNNCFQNQTLSSIRDALLPKLMSGEMRVSVGGL